MKKKDRDSIRTMKQDELTTQERQVRAKILDMRTQVYAGKIKNLRELKMLRNKLAVILTMLKQKERVYEQK